MKSKFLAFLAVILSLSGVNAVAQDHTRNWENGYVVVVTEVHLNDGMFNAYINDLNNVWRRYVEAQKDDGGVVRYGIYSNTTAREGEPDLYLTVTFEKWANFDLGPEYFENLTDEIMGSMENLRGANLNRAELRTIGSSYALQEIKFKE